MPTYSLLSTASYSRAELSPEAPLYGCTYDSSVAGVVTANSTGLANVMTDAISTSKTVKLRPGLMRIDNTIHAADRTPLSMTCDGWAELRMMSDNLPILTLGTEVDTSHSDDLITIDGLKLSYNTLQTGFTLSDGVQVKNLWYSKIGRIWVEKAYNGWNTFSGYFMFSCEINSIKVKPYVSNGIKWITSGLGNTGCTIGNIYISNGSLGAVTAAGSRALNITAMNGGSIKQVNVEWTSFTNSPIYLDTARPVNIEALHIEGITISANGKGFVNVVGNSVVDVSAMDLYNNTIGATCPQTAVFSLGDGAVLDIAALHIQDNTLSGTGGTKLRMFQSDDNTLGGTSPRIRCGPVNLIGTHGITKIDETITKVSGSVQKKARAVMEFGELYSTGGGVFQLGDAADTLHRFQHPFNIELKVPITAARTITLSNVLGAAASTAWTGISTPEGVSFLITRTAAATGAFNLIIANHDATTLALLTPGTWVRVNYDGTNWYQAAGGTLVAAA